MEAILNLINHGRAWEAIHTLVMSLKARRADMHPNEWRRYVQEELLQHPVRAFAHACPFTRRCFEKPRGYAGDVVMLDYIYGVDPIPQGELDTVTEEVFRYTTNSPATRALRYRRRVLAQISDETCEQNPAARILSLACGQPKLAIADQPLGEISPVKVCPPPSNRKSNSRLLDQNIQRELFQEIFPVFQKQGIAGLGSHRSSSGR